MSIEDVPMVSHLLQEREDLVCSRCDRHTGNRSQGHFWAWCKVTMSIRDNHFCCPGDCELEVRR